MAWKKIQWSDDAGAVTVRKNSGSNIGTRPRLNFIEGSNITLAISDDAGSDEIDISIAASGGGSTTWVGLTDTPGSFTAGKIPRVNSGATALEFKANAVPTTFVVAATVANDCKDPLRADYQVDGTADQTEINIAINALPT